MTSLFVYGTLRHLPLLEIVLGRPLGEIDQDAAHLPDHGVYWVKDAPFPMIEPKEHHNAPGLLLRNLSAEDIARMNFYEGGFSYDLRRVQVNVDAKGQDCQAYFPQAGLWPRGQIWDLADWQARWGEVTEEAAREVMSYYGQLTAQQVAQMFSTIRARAASQINARNARAANPSGMGRKNVTLHQQERAYVDYFALDELHLQFDRFDGQTSAIAKRAVFMSTDAVIVLPYDPRRDRVLLVEQFRTGPYARGDAQPWQLEPIAGRVDFGETPEQTAVREASEETGLQLNELRKVAQCYSSPGCTTEYFYIYLALTELPDGVTGVGGVVSEEEDIRSHVLSFDALMEMVDAMQAANAPLVLAALWLARHRDQLRRAT